MDRSGAARLLPLPIVTAPAGAPASLTQSAAGIVPGELPVATRATAILPGETPVALPATDGPPADGIAAVRASLLPAERATAPDPATLPFYDVDLTVEPEGGRIRGVEKIDVPAREPRSSLPLRIFANGGDETLVHVTSVRALVTGAALPFTTPLPSLVRVKLPGPVAPGSWIHLEIAFAGRAPAPPPPASGFGMLGPLLSSAGRAGDYGLFSTFHDGIALAEFLPMAAGHWRGALDTAPPTGIGDASYFDLSSFRVRIDTPEGFVVAAPGALVSEERLAEGRHAATWALADARDFAIFASRGYQEADRMVGSTLVRSIYEEGQGDAGRSVLRTAEGALDLFSRLYRPYPYTSFTAVEVPLRGGAGGAEFPGLVAVGGMVYGERGALPGGLSFGPGFLAQMREFVVAHETAHQWWACAVASQPRLQPDVDEPLAQYSAAVYVGRTHGEGARKEVLGSQVGVNYQAMRMLGQPDGPVARGTGEFSDEVEYAGLVYGKAPLFYEAAAARWGDDAVSRALSAYARRRWFGLARRGDVIGPLAAAAGAPALEVRDLFDHWFRQAHGDEDLAGVGNVTTIASEAFGLQAGSLDVEKLLQAGAALAPLAPPPSGTPPALPAVDPQQALKILEQFNRTMGGIDDSSP